MVSSRIFEALLRDGAKRRVSCSRGARAWAGQPSRPWMCRYSSAAHLGGSKGFTSRVGCRAGSDNDPVRPRNFATAETVASQPAWRVQENLLSHPDVAKCRVIDGIAYVVKRKKPLVSNVLSFFNGCRDEVELGMYLKKQWQYPDAAVPQIRFVQSFPTDENQQVPFMLGHILHTLFREVDRDKNGVISLEEFLVFCRERELFNTSQAEAKRTFDKAARDGFNPSRSARVTYEDFKRLVLHSGIIEVRGHDTNDDGQLNFTSYFVEEHVVDVVLRRWFGKYACTDNRLSFSDYVRLVRDYELPVAVSADAFRSFDTNNDGSIDLQEFRELLTETKVLATGVPVKSDDTVGRVWREVSASQKFLPPTSVRIADGRPGASPPQLPGTLRFVCISDTHGRHEELTPRLPRGDVLLHAGDFSMAGELDEVQDFGRWLQSLEYEKKIVIAGNHDLSFDKSYTGHHSKDDVLGNATREAFLRLCDTDGSLIYLEDAECSIRGVRIYGTPWQPEFGCWAFNLKRGSTLADKWRAIPVSVDVLLVHGPPLGRGDLCLPSNQRSGCADLLAEIQDRIHPAFCVFGHVHEGAGVTFDGKTHYVNASSVNEHYEVVHPPLVFDIPIPTSE
eukprot:TRINITY_DN50801_c0_g1_i1.p1 TRINITY_DN50801_c0_g1~~TRINITY_DN50801_c0_g1_i1.p1  ORF type:complete len:649 (-),score=64.94 TRINITY_DN50801_c0_g1_i1:47-1903(-)